MPFLKDVEFKQFLTDPGVLMRIGVNQDDGFPLVTPIWFIFREGAVYFTPREKSSWFASLRRDNRVSLCIDEETQPYRKILVQGLAELVYDTGNDDVWRDLYLAMASRYVPKNAAHSYVENTRNEPRGLYRVVLSDSAVRSWRMPITGENSMGIWHEKYYRPNTKF
mgnify:CR=1 FL=1